MSEVLVLAGAEAHLFALYDKLEAWREGLGDRFDADFQNACSTLSKYPRIGPPFEGRFRRLLMVKWQVGLFYAIDGNRVVVHAVLDLRQSPNAIRRQLGLNPDL